MVKQIFVNLPVKNLDAAKEFWLKLGFSFNAQFTDENAASLELGENIYAMLLVPEFFSTFTNKTITDTAKNIEVINALSLESKAEVDSLMEKIISAGGSESRPVQDYGWMYSRAFFDLDGHQWELIFMDATNLPAEPSEATSLHE